MLPSKAWGPPLEGLKMFARPAEDNGLDHSRLSLWGQRDACGHGGPLLQARDRNHGGLGEQQNSSTRPPCGQTQTITFLEIDYYPTTRGIRSRVYAVECTDEIRTANLVEDIDDAASEIAEKIFLFVRVKNYKHPKIRILLSPEARLPPSVCLLPPSASSRRHLEKPASGGGS